MTLDEDDQIVKLSEPTVNQPLEKENDGDIIVDKVILAKGKNITETPKHRPPSIVCKGRFKLRHSIMYYEDVKTEHRWIRF
ncbi:hypothetical protein QR680_010208 [Steinernema hermaphroditum]|uniref:Uncharacterized protein n=1 Tax=Steinernema hermaphroditum TaxID=289476 RepID=A0AA39IQ16_9BILA|nr:hypothetical protein QR680_010208 [Steinernema hermaphroditum]